MMDYITAVINSRQDGLSVDEDLNRGLFGTVEAKVYLVESWSNSQYHGFVFVPQEVLRTSINGLYLPWNRKTVL